MGRVASRFEVTRYEKYAYADRYSLAERMVSGFRFKKLKDILLSGREDWTDDVLDRIDAEQQRYMHSVWVQSLGDYPERERQYSMQHRYDERHPRGYDPIYLDDKTVSRMCINKTKSEDNHMSVEPVAEAAPVPVTPQKRNELLYGKVEYLWDNELHRIVSVEQWRKEQAG